MLIRVKTTFKLSAKQITNASTWIELHQRALSHMSKSVDANKVLQGHILRIEETTFCSLTRTMTLKSFQLEIRKKHTTDSI